MIRCTPEVPNPRLSLADAAQDAPTDAQAIEAAMATLSERFCYRVQLLAKSLYAAVANREGESAEKFTAFCLRAGLEGSVAEKGVSAFLAARCFVKLPAVAQALWRDDLFDEWLESAEEFQEALSAPEAAPVARMLAFLVTALAQSLGVPDVREIVNVVAEDDDLQRCAENSGFSALVAGAATELLFADDMLAGYRLHQALKEQKPVNITVTTDMIANVPVDYEGARRFSERLESVMPASDRMLFGKALVSFTAVWNQLRARKRLGVEACDKLKISSATIAFEVSLMKFAEAVGSDLLANAGAAGLMMPEVKRAETPEELEAMTKADADRLWEAMAKFTEREDLFSRGTLGEIQTIAELFRELGLAKVAPLVAAALSERDRELFPQTFRMLERLSKAIVDNDPLFPPQR